MPFWSTIVPPPKFSLANMSRLHQHLHDTVVVTERNRAAVVDNLRTIAELVLWGDQNDPVLFDFFLEKNMLGIFWRLLEQRETPVSVKVQMLQTLSILISNIEAGPSIYYILSNDHINELIRHPFDFSHEELLAHYISLLKAIALRLDEHTVQCRHLQRLRRRGGIERMVRTAVRTIVLSVCKVAEAAVQEYVCGSGTLPQVLVAALLAEHERASASVEAVEESLGRLLDEARPAVLSHAPLLDALATLFLHPALRLDAVSTPRNAPWQ
ncbi:hypothetical protein EMIHUDRAFT_456574, partial [Emiliania huxleyi CCMP1516]|uniref:FPL domain-containing protein n=2 Tax=Emiliania huxleyi TaxID=2903 RepID=A0A0D3K434_EMIH1